MKLSIIKYVKSLVIDVFKENTTNILKKIEKYDAVCFDIYDTLIKRNIKKPTDVFDLIEQEYNKNFEISIKNFKQLRINAEKDARKNCVDEEITIDYIYDNLKAFGTNEKKELMNLEIKIEKKIAMKNNAIYPIYKKCLDLHKKIFVISDMYLPLEVIKEILYSAGYTKFDKIYLSSVEKNL